MTEGFTYIIDMLNNEHGNGDKISPREVVRALRVGIRTEPERFPDFVEAFINRLHRAYPEWTEEKRVNRALENIAGFAVMVDHDYRNEMIPRACLGGPDSPKDYLDRPEEYGLFMKELANYVGSEGIELRKLLLGD